MEPIKFYEEWSHTGQLYYEPANKLAFEVIEFLRPNNQSEIINEPAAEKIFPWLEALGHPIEVVQGKNYKHAQGI